MIEQEIEGIIIEKVRAQLAACGLAENVQIFGLWQPSAPGDIKAVGDGSKAGAVSVKVKPRSYATFTSKEAEFSVHIDANFRMEMDADGRGYLDRAEKIVALFVGWHKSYANYAADFAIQNKFSPTGFRLDGGDGGLDVQAGVWTLLQDFTVQGIVKE